MGRQGGGEAASPLTETGNYLVEVIIMGMDQLKKALIDAGIVTKEKLREEQREKMTQRHIAKQRKEGHEHQLRIVCELCSKTSPDVEYYEHQNRMVGDKKWLCMRCADDHQIDDRLRKTAQSQNARTNLFIRQYGRTQKV